MLALVSPASLVSPVSRPSAVPRPPLLRFREEDPARRICHRISPLWQPPGDRQPATGWGVTEGEEARLSPGSSTRVRPGADSKGLAAEPARVEASREERTIDGET